jgi:hypothetical protein
MNLDIDFHFNASGMAMATYTEEAFEDAQDIRTPTSQRVSVGLKCLLNANGHSFIQPSPIGMS